MSLSEAEVYWRQFLESLQKRGLAGVRLITSDDHSGLKAALRAVYPVTPWQRCQFHLSQNAQSYAPKKHMRLEIAEAMRSIFNSPSLETAETMIKSVVDIYSTSAPEFVNWLENNVRESFTC